MHHLRKVTVVLKIELDTRSDSNFILSALNRGIYRGLDTAGSYIATPIDVNISQVSYDEECSHPNTTEIETFPSTGYIKEKCGDCSAELLLKNKKDNHNNN